MSSSVDALTPGASIPHTSCKNRYKIIPVSYTHLDPIWEKKLPTGIFPFAVLGGGLDKDSKWKDTGGKFFLPYGVIAKVLDVYKRQLQKSKHIIRCMAVVQFPFSHSPVRDVYKRQVYGLAGRPLQLSPGRKMTKHEDHVLHIAPL